MNKFILLSLAALALTLSAASCDEQEQENQNTQSTTEARTLAPSPFSADSAYQHVAYQVAQGPRVPNTPGHKATSTYFTQVLAGWGIPVTEQKATITAYDGTALEIVNIIASYRPEAKERVMLFAHWDTRPWADRESDEALRLRPIPGADDGASGPGVMLELARLLSEVGLQNIGVDLMFFDAEDYGQPDWAGDPGADHTDTWALGTQYWTKNLHTEGYMPKFGILLDMVGAKDARFLREYFSQESAGNRVTDIWRTAVELGHERFFVNKMGGAITDDHYFVIRNLRIPCVDIINYDGDFAPYWHTHNDNMDNISKETLQAVGETLWQVLQDVDQGHIQ